LILLPKTSLPKTTLQQLQLYQAEVNSAVDYPSQVALAKQAFSRRNKARNPVFRVVRSKLNEMCGGHGRCCYCELSQPDEVEHVHPKDLFPELTFSWKNFVYACGICNGTRKNNRFAIIDKEGQLQDITRPLNVLVKRPPKGHPALINPRTEDPLNFMELDLVDTFWFLPSAETDSLEYIRAEYTIELLGLNRDLLLRARANAFGGYRARLVEYGKLLKEDAAREILDRLKADLLKSPHPAVWREMQRQGTHHPTLKGLFQGLPEALTWN
jgi:uncharacterized protein (TIGR02646 family)